MTYGWTWRIWVSPTSTASWTPRSPRQASPATQWRALPSSSPLHRSRGRPPAAPTFAPARPQQQPSLRPQRGAGSRKVAQPVSAPVRPMKCQGKRRSWDGRTQDTGSGSSGDGESAPSHGGGLGGKSFFPFLGCSATGSLASGTQTFRAVSYVSGSQGGEDGSARDTVSTPPSPSSFTSGQQGPVRGCDAFSRAPCPSVEPGKCRTAHSDPTSERAAFRVGPLCSTSLPHCGYICGFPGPACTVSGGLASAPQAVSLAHENIRLGYAIQFARRPPKFRGVRFTSVLNKDAPVLRAEVAVLLAKDAIEPVPPAEMKSGFYSPYFIVPKKGGGLRPILDLRVLNRALHKLPFKMLTQRRIFQCIRPFDWFAAIDLKDTYFHVSILPRHRPFLRFAFEGRAYQYKVLPFGLSLSPRVFTKVVEAALVPLREAGIRVLNYLDDWLILAHTGPVSSAVVRTQGHGAQPPQPVGASGQLGKEQTLPCAEDLFLDSVNLTARLSVERAQSMLNCLESFQSKSAVPLKHFQRLLGHMASAAAVTPLGLLHMRLLQHWLHDQVPRWAWRRGTYRVSVNCLELLAVWLALRRFKVLLHDKHVLVRTDNTATVAYINHQGGLRSRRMSQLARHLLLWSQKHLRWLRAVHIPGELIRAADELSRQPALPGEWRLHPEVVQLIWRRFGDAQVDLFASPDTFHCQLFYSLSEGTLGMDALAHSWPRGLRKYAFLPVSLLAQTLCKVREDEEQVLLVAPYWPNRTWFPELMLLATAPPWQIPLRRDLLSQRGGTLWHPRPDLWNLHVWSLDGTRRF